MEILSLQFAIFVLFAVIVYHVLPFKYKKLWLILSSSYFYILFDVRFFLVLVLLGIANFWLAKKQIISEKSSHFSSLPLLLNLSAFGLLKVFSSRYAGSVIGLTNQFQSTWLLPVGFSFYILQLISFQLDIRSRKIVHLPSLEDFSLYLVYFPKLLSGPIEKPRVFFERLASPKVVDNGLISHGLGLIFLGVLRKLFIANLLSQVMPDWINEAHSIGWPQVIGFVLLVYNDFAGYTSIVRGVSCLFGIELSPNFQQPFLSRNFSEFWNRWHISLSTWLRETIFFPLSRKLGRNSGSRIAVGCAIIVPPMVTMLASGFWHGASLAMILWGGLQGAFLINERLIYDRWPRLRPQSLPWIGRFLSGLIVLLLFSFSMVPFAVNAAKPTLIIWSGLFTKTGFAMNQAVIPILLLGGFSFLLDVLSQKSGKELWWEDLPIIALSAVMAAGLIILAIAVLLNTVTPGSVFIYQGF